MPKLVDDVAGIRGRKPKYPREWFDGQPREFVRGTDFECDAKRFRNRLIDAARARGFSSRSEVLGSDRVRFTTTGKHPGGARCGHRTEPVSMNRPALMESEGSEGSES
jgi:hypothetical protein